MISIDNINIMTEKFPEAWRIIKEKTGGRPPAGPFAITAAKNGRPTLTVTQEGRTYYLHSRYDPEEEARRFTGQFREVKKYKHVFFYGVGLGYHIEAFTRVYPDLPFTIYEPRTEIFAHYLAHKSLADLPLKSLERIYIENTPAANVQFLANYADYINGEVLFVALPSYERLFPENYQEFTTIFQNILAGKRVALGTNYAYQKKWTLNSLANLQRVLGTPNILDEEIKGYFRGKPALIVAAGPSVHEEMENIRYIKENGLAYIFSVGSGIIPLLKEGIHPDAACVYDPKRNIFVYKKVIKERITTIPLIFGSSVGTDIFPDYPGPMLHMIMGQDTVAPYFLRFSNGEKPAVIQDAPTIAIVTLQLLAKLGASPVILAGQNLAYKDDLVYAKGIPYYNPKLTEKKRGQAFPVEDVYGGQVYTSEGLNMMRLNMEYFINMYKKVEFINTTKGGAKIKGARFLPLETVIKERLDRRVVVRDWYKKSSAGYDRAYLREQQARMDEEISNLKKLFKSFDRNFETMNNLVARGNAAGLEKFFHKFDKDLKKLLKNQCYQVLLKPLNRVELELLGKKIDKIRFETDSVTKGRQVKEEFGKFIAGCRQELAPLETLYHRLREATVTEEKTTGRTG